MNNSPYSDTSLATRLDLPAIAAWNAANERARRAYYAQPNACTRAIYKGSYR